MKNILCLLPLVAILLGSCDNTGMNEEELEYDLSYLSGEWQGQLTIEKAGSCMMASDSVRVYDDIILMWAVSTEGNIIIQEDNGFPFAWEGVVDTTLRVELVKVFAWERGLNSSCPDSMVIGTANYSGDITEDTAKYFIEFDAVENWCPADDCIFHLYYSLSKSK